MFKADSGFPATQSNDRLTEFTFVRDEKHAATSSMCETSGWYPFESSSFPQASLKLFELRIMPQPRIGVRTSRFDSYAELADFRGIGGVYLS
jgi:hypothetical protein